MKVKPLTTELVGELVKSLEKEVRDNDVEIGKLEQRKEDMERKIRWLKKELGE